MAVKNEVIYLDFDSDLSIDPERPVLIKPGSYKVILIRYWKGYLYGGTPKFILVFKIISGGIHNGVHLYRCYNIKGLTKRKEVVTKGWHSDFVREYSKLFGAPRKLRDIRIVEFKNKVFVCSVRAVTKDYKQRTLPDDMRYSVIDELIEVYAG
jgi:hypothetical protein